MLIIGLSMAVLPCRAEEDVEAGSAALRVDWPVYPRRTEHNTVAEGGNKRWAETARQNGVPIALAEGRPDGVQEARQGGRSRHARKAILCGRGAFPSRPFPETGRATLASADKSRARSPDNPRVRRALRKPQGRPLGARGYAAARRPDLGVVVSIRASCQRHSVLVRVLLCEQSQPQKAGLRHNGFDKLGGCAMTAIRIVGRALLPSSA
jgi:hypothetical protein